MGENIIIEPLFFCTNCDILSYRSAMIWCDVICSYKDWCKFYLVFMYICVENELHIVDLWCSNNKRKVVDLSFDIVR